MKHSVTIATGLAAAVVAGLGLVCGLSGCAQPVIESSACVDWVLFDSPADAAAEADGLVTGHVVQRSSPIRQYGVDVNVWTVEVDSWVIGSGDDEIHVASSPRTCESGSPYPDGDPLDTDEDVMIFIQELDGRMQTLTGFQGVIPAPIDGNIPDAW